MELKQPNHRRRMDAGEDTEVFSGITTWGTKPSDVLNPVQERSGLD